MAGFKIIFGSHNGDFELTWTLNNKALSHNWLQKLDYVSKNKVIDNPRRFYGLPQASKVQIYNVMTESIQQLNQKGFDIPVKPIEREVLIIKQSLLRSLEQNTQTTAPVNLDRLLEQTHAFLKRPF